MDSENAARRLRIDDADWLVTAYALDRDEMALVLGRDMRTQHPEIVEDDEDRFVIDNSDGTVFGFFRTTEKFVSFSAYGGWRVSLALEGNGPEVQR